MLATGGAPSTRKWPTATDVAPRSSVTRTATVMSPGVSSVTVSFGVARLMAYVPLPSMSQAYSTIEPDGSAIDEVASNVAWLWALSTAGPESAATGAWRATAGAART